MQYHINTIERPYKETKVYQNVLEMDEKRFDEFLEAVHIGQEEERDEDGKVIDSQTVFVFNSGLRHRACKVIRMKDDLGILYQYHDNPMLRHFEPEFKNYVESLRANESQAA